MAGVAAMKISVSGKNMDTGGSFQEHANDALTAAVVKYFDNAISGSVTLSKGTAGFDVGIRITLTRRIVMEASGAAADAHVALEQAVNHIEKRLRRYHRRLKNHRVDVPADDIIPATVTVFAPEEPEAEAALPEDVSSPPILAEMDYEVHLMTVEEAVMVFELSGQSALMFRNKAHLGLNMLHRRDDGSIGWVDPRGNR